MRLGGSLVSWRSKKQTSQALSTLEAEYISLTEGLKELVWCRQFLNEMEIENVNSVVYEDNLSCIALAKGESKHFKAKHIDISFYWNQDILSKGVLD